MVTNLSEGEYWGMAKVTPNFKPEKPRYFFKEWRKHRGFTQEELAELIGVTPPSISQLERGLQGFTDSTLESLASALSCKPGDLLMRNPLDEDAPWSIWDHLKPDQKKSAMLFIKAMEAETKRTGTDG